MADEIHKIPRRSIYDRFDYLVNSDMSIPFTLATTWNYGVASEIARRSGFPPVDRRPQLTPIVLVQRRIPPGR